MHWEAPADQPFISKPFIIRTLRCILVSKLVQGEEGRTRYLLCLPGILRRVEAGTWLKFPNSPSWSRHRSLHMGLSCQPQRQQLLQNVTLTGLGQWLSQENVCLVNMRTWVPSPASRAKDFHVVAHTCNLTAREAEMAGSLGLNGQPAWPTCEF